MDRCPYWSSVRKLRFYCITETKLDESFSSQLYQCAGFKCHRKDRNDKSGGMMVYVREDIPHSRLFSDEIEVPECHIECIILRIHMKKLRFNLTCLYKNPKVSHNVFIEQMSTMLNKLCSNGEENVVIGDLNIDMSTRDNAIDSQICDVYGLKNLMF